MWEKSCIFATKKSRSLYKMPRPSKHTLVSDMKRLGLIGRTLKHSWSKRWFDELFAHEGITDVCYNLYELPDIEHLREWVRAEGLAGFNVTIPYKEAVITHLDAVDPVATAIGAVNCVTVHNGHLVGHNTDAPAFADTLRPHLRPWHTSALILGTGGASKAVDYTLRQMGIKTAKVSRNPASHPGTVSYLKAQELAATHYLIVNTTPMGMYPDMAFTPWPPPHCLSPKHLCYDLIYNPEETRFMTESKLFGAQVCNGLPMLERQAELSWSLYLTV